MTYVKPLAWTIILFLSFTLSAAAKTKYVADIREITLRTGPGTEYKISAFIPSGNPLTVIEEADTWTKVQTSDGKEGWVLSRFIQTELPNSIVLKKLQTLHDVLVTEKAGLATENELLKTKNKEMEADLAGIRETLSRVETDYETLKKESADFIALKAKLKTSTALLSEAQEKAIQYEKDYTRLYNDQRIKWFLFGAGVLLLGIIIGYGAKSQRKKSVLR
ncbi:MAG: TIGR04211 family SH3 domain-containing protein [Desulfobacterales bacterium]|jgi:SH3 domain protein|nr:TIGR04211 family SH3 domain-containing protein [Desulfobacterales bacterium]